MPNCVVIVEFMLQKFHVFFWKTKWKVHLGTRRPETKECESVEACATGITVSAGVRSEFIDNTTSSFLVNCLTHVLFAGT